MSNEHAQPSGLRPHSRDPRCPGFAPAPATRRGFLQATGLGFGWTAFAGLAPAWSAGPSAAGLHLPARARHVIFLFMDGGVSHVDTFDYKPELTKRNGERVSWSAYEDKIQLAQNAGGDRKWLGSLWPFSQRGQSGLWVSDLLPNIAGIADDLCVVRSLVGESPLHGAQNLLTHTGRSIGAAPSMGAWITHGLGSENDNLPGYVLLSNGHIPNGGMELFSSGFLPATCQATMVRSTGEPVGNIVAADPPEVQRAKLAFLREQALATAGPAEADTIDAAIRTFETAARMQTTIPDVCDVSRETEATRRLYGVGRKGKGFSAGDEFYALQCLRARRLVEAGVRFVEVTCPPDYAQANGPWDQHGEIKSGHEGNARIIDQPVAALITDLKQRGLLDETIVLWAGEMGRTPFGGQGRDHHVSGYTIWMAGGGFKRGTVFGATDEMGMVAVDQPLDIHDIHATILHQMGVDHKQLAFRFGGRDVRLTDVKGRVIRDLIS